MNKSYGQQASAKRNHLAGAFSSKILRLVGGNKFIQRESNEPP